MLVVVLVVQEFWERWGAKPFASAFQAGNRKMGSVDLNQNPVEAAKAEGMLPLLPLLTLVPTMMEIVPTLRAVMELELAWLLSLWARPTWLPWLAAMVAVLTAAAATVVVLVDSVQQTGLICSSCFSLLFFPLFKTIFLLLDPLSFYFYVVFNSSFDWKVCRSGWKVLWNPNMIHELAFDVLFIG